MNTSPIVFLMDDSYKTTGFKHPDGSSAIGNMKKFLLRLCKRADNQPAYFHRVRIYYGNKLISLESGKSEEQLTKFFDDGAEGSTLTDYISFWRSTYEADPPNTISYFIMTAYIEEEIFESFDDYKNMVFLMEFDSFFKNPLLAARYNNFAFMDQHNVESRADAIHESFLKDYVTTVNFGLPFNAEFFTVNTKHNYQMSIEDIKVCGMTTAVPAEGFPVLSKSFLLPVSDCYNNVVKHYKTFVSNEVGYVLLKQALGDESDPVSDDPEDKDGNWSLAGTSKEESRNKEQADLLDSLTTPTMPADGPPSFTFDTPDDAQGIREVKKEDEDDEDEEYLPVKKRGGKRGLNKPPRAPAKRAKLAKVVTPVTPKRSTRSSTRIKNQETPEKVEENVAEETPNTEMTEVKPEPTEPAAPQEETTEQPAAAATKTEIEIQEVAEEKPDEMCFMVRVVERHTGIARPAFIRLRGLYDDDKTYYDAETLQKKIEEDAAKKAEEEAAKAAHTSTAFVGPVFPNNDMDDSPASPDADGPASPDLAPVISHDIKMIPTEPTITAPIIIPTTPVAAQDVDMRIPTTFAPAQDVDMRMTSVPMQDTDLRGLVAPTNTAALLQTLATSEDIDMRDLSAGAQDVDYRAQAKPEDVDGSDKVVVKIEGVEVEPITDSNIDEKETLIKQEQIESCISDIPEEIEEPPMEELINTSQGVVKCIPVESESEREMRRIKEEEEAAATPQDDQSKLLEVIVLDVTWKQYKSQVAIVDDEKGAELIAQREKTVVGPEPSHDYDRLPGWYSNEAMQFYINKLLRAIRKIQDRTALFEKEIQNLSCIVVYSQSKHYADFFGRLILEETDVHQSRAVEMLAAQTAEYFTDLPSFFMPEERTHSMSHMNHPNHPNHMGHMSYMNHMNHMNYTNQM